MGKPKNKERVRGKWSAEDLKTAIKQINEKKISVQAASREFNIPRRTLRGYISKNTDVKQKVGAKCTLSDEHEAAVVERILSIYELGFPLTTKLLQKTAAEYCRTEGLPNKFSNAAGKDWLYGFLERHPEISRLRSEHLKESRAKKTNSRPESEKIDVPFASLFDH